jgi:hypothetical protein
MRVGDAAEIFEGAQVVLDDAIAIGIHPAELPLRHGMAALGGVLQRVQRGRGNRVAAPSALRTGPSSGPGPRLARRPAG